MSSLVQQCCPLTKLATIGAKAAREALQQALREGLQQAIGDPVAREALRRVLARNEVQCRPSGRDAPPLV
jgi:hypothetical protein